MDRCSNSLDPLCTARAISTIQLLTIGNEGVQYIRVLFLIFGLETKRLMHRHTAVQASQFWVYRNCTIATS